MSYFGKLNKTQARKSLIAAILSGDIDSVARELDRRPDVVDARNAHGNTPAGEAVSGGDLEIVRLLVERGADARQVNGGGSSLLDRAASAGQRAIAKYLVACGCPYLPHHAAAVDDIHALARMLDGDARAVLARDRRDATPLHHAARADSTRCVRALLTAGADVQAIDRHGHEPLAYAVEANAIQAARALLDAGANCNAAAGHNGGVMLHRALTNRHLDMAELLLEQGASPNRRDHAGKTALHEAVAIANRSAVELLLRYDPDLTARTRKTRMQPGGETPLDYAVRRRQNSIVELIRNAPQQTGGPS
ncbi:MAG: hypothetical protein F4Y86_08485 [Gammaproteobacteria bacterium]|nr:hypothetical protein [Gammaproteobacteria bacterium]